MKTHSQTPSQTPLHTQQKQMASAFWKSYFAKFRRIVQDQEASETLPAPLGTDDAPWPQPALRPPVRRTESANSPLR